MEQHPVDADASIPDIACPGDLRPGRYPNYKLLELNTLTSLHGRGAAMDKVQEQRTLVAGCDARARSPRTRQYYPS